MVARVEHEPFALDEEARGGSARGSRPDRRRRSPAGVKPPARIATANGWSANGSSVPAGGPGRLDHDALERVEHRPFALGEAGHVEAVYPAGRRSARARRCRVGLERRRRRRPMTDGRFDGDTGEQLELVRRRPSRARRSRGRRCRPARPSRPVVTGAMSSTSPPPTVSSRPIRAARSGRPGSSGSVTGRKSAADRARPATARSAPSTRSLHRQPRVSRRRPIGATT